VKDVLLKLGGMRARLVVALAAVLLALSALAAHAAPPGHERVWELVTNGPTNGVHVADTQAWSHDGTRVVLVSFGPMPGADAGDLLAVTLATREASGWVMKPISEPYSLPTLELQTNAPLALDPTFSSWLWQSDRPLLPDAPPWPESAYYRRAPAGSLTLVGPVGAAADTRFVAASDDIRHGAFQSTAHLLPADAGRISGGAAYEFDGDQLRLVGVDSSGVALSPCGSLVGSGERFDDDVAHPVSRNGARIWFTAPATGDCGVPRRVYVRIDGTQTLEASACQRLDCGPPADATFASATRDGAVAFLITTQQLTDDDADAAADLYRYDVADRALTRLSAGPPGVVADVQGRVVLVSGDGARTYFLAVGQLVPGMGDAGRPNLYLSDHGTLRYVATGDDLDLHRAAISADGRVLAFATTAALLPSDTDAQTDVYRYDAQTGVLQQVSLGVGGRGNDAADVSFGMPGSPPPLQQDEKQWMTSDGSRVAFVTSEPLLPEDTNTASDAYEWADGTLGLLSSGTGDAPVVFQGFSSDGSSAFFATGRTLVAADRNGGDDDLYDARLNGGFPDSPATPPPCDGDACQGPPVPRPQRPIPPTLTHVEHPPAVQLHPLGRRARARLVAHGETVVFVDVRAAGRVSLIVRAPIAGRSVVVARDSAAAHSQDTVRLRLRLSPAARRLLASGRRLHLTLVVRQADHDATQRLMLRARRGS
jgi:hypothetical protein